MKLLYIACSSYSGSTLLSFLLNTHPKIMTVGHTTGWHFSDTEEFFCSCGERIEKCPFFNHVRRAFEARKIPFAFNDFGTEYLLSENERLNRLLTAGSPYLPSSAMEKARDGVVRLVPGFAARLSRQDLANRTFIEAALDYGGAEVYADNSHGPHRLRHLSRISDLALYPVHLVRDPRGVVLSHMKHRGWSADFAAWKWLDEQADIARVLQEFDRRATVHYEDVCDDTDAALARLHAFAGLEEVPVPEDFKSVEHHILGNKMRESSSRISSDRRWESELSTQDLRAILGAVEGFMRKHPRTPLANVLERYLAAASA
jgi:hypothetical protein